MKIAFLAAKFPPTEAGGLEIATYRTARALASRGHDVHVITTTDPRVGTEYREEGFTVHRVPALQKAGRREHPDLHGFYRIIRTIRPDIVNAQQLKMGWPAFLANIRLGIPYVIFGRGGKRMLPADEKTSFRRLAKRVVLSRASAAIVLTTSMKKEFTREYSGQVYVVPNGIDLSGLPGYRKRESRISLGIGTEENVVLFAGRLQKIKGLVSLVEAMEGVVREHSSATLYLVGNDDGERQRLEERTRSLGLAGNVTFTGGVTNDEVLAYMAAADMIALPSLSEGFPNVLIEAMAYGLPIVCTNVDGLPEIVREGENGFLVPPGDPEALAQKISLFLRDEGLRSTIGANNRERVKDFGIDAVAEALEGIYSRHSKGNRPAASE